ncbi:hypothetical protein ACOME3_004680 [Neoechinorhynchus agilis]
MDRSQAFAKRKMNVAPVRMFAHAPFLLEMEDLVHIGMIAEIPYFLSEQPYPVYWFAEIIAIDGYMCCFKYLDGDCSQPIWLNIGCPEIYPLNLGERQSDRIIEIPVSLRKQNVSGYLEKEFTDKEYVTGSIRSTLHEELESVLKVGMLVEVSNMSENNCVQLGRVIQVRGRRAQIVFSETPSYDVWMHEMDENLHPPGWAAFLGVSIDADKEYLTTYRNILLSMFLRR